MFGDVSWRGALGLFVSCSHSNTPSLVGAAAGCPGLLLLHANRHTASQRASRGSGLHISCCVAVSVKPPTQKKMPAFLWAMSLDVRSKQGNVRSSWERQRVSLQLALLCWGVVLRSRKPFILPPLTPHKSGNTSIHLCIQIPCWGEGWLYMGWRKLVKQNLKPHQLGRAYFLLTIFTWAFLRLPFFS